MLEIVRSLVSGAEIEGSGPRSLSAYDGQRIGEVYDADVSAVAAAAAATKNSLSCPFPPAERAAVLKSAAIRVRESADLYTTLLMRESAKPFQEASAEVSRAAALLDECAEEATRIVGHLVPVQGVSGSEDRTSFTVRVPVGVVAAITPFNGALLSPAHKVGAAIAAGNACILKPADLTPLTAGRFVSDLLDVGLPADRLALLVSEGPEVPRALVASPDVAMVSFTGSTAVGMDIRQNLGLRPAILELGGNAPLIVHEDADVEVASAAAVPGAFGYSGQICISVQRVFIHSSKYDEFRDRFVQKVGSLRVGMPDDPKTDIGPLLSEQRAEDLEAGLRRALSKGATALTPIRREGALVWPAVLEGLDHSDDLVCEEAFGPFVALFSYDRIEEAFVMANATEYGLQAGVFTSDFSVMHRAIHELNFGGVIFNDTSRYRVDRMPYGGVKASGQGREGVKYSIEQMTQERLVVLKPAEDHTARR